MPFAKHDQRKRQGLPNGVKGKSNPSRGNTPCHLCEALPKDQLAAVEEAFLKGEPPHKIAEEHGLAAHDVSRHAHRCLATRHESRYARVARAFDLLWSAIDLAHETYMSDPSMYNGTSYQGLLKQLRALMVDLDNVQNSDELSADLTQYALNPMITALTNAVISEAGGLKEDLTAKFDDSEAERLVGDFVRRLSQHFTQAAKIAHDRIRDTLSARDKNRQTAAGGPGRPKKPQGKHANLRAVS
jgi:hypothetical protein